MKEAKLRPYEYVISHVVTYDIVERASLEFIISRYINLIVVHPSVQIVISAIIPMVKYYKITNNITCDVNSYLN